MAVQEQPKPIPPPPADITDSDQIANGQIRWDECPLKDCKKNPELLYEDFYLRGIRSNRLLCSACAVRVEMGYMAREEVRKADDKFFKGTQADNLIALGIMFVGSLVVNALMLVIGFWFLAFFVGGGAGAALGSFARRFSKGRVTRQMPFFAIAGIILGAVLAPTVYFLLSTGIFFFSLAAVFNLSILIASGAMASAAYGIFRRRI